MSRIKWDPIGERCYETGADKFVLFPFDDGAYTKGVAWNGVTKVNQKPSGAEPTPLYADNIKYVNMMSAEDYACSIEAYMYPDEFAECDGSAQVVPGMYAGQQRRKMFGFAYRTIIGNDTKLNDFGYKLHLVYGCLAAPTEKAYNTINDSPEASTMSWEISTTPVVITEKVGGKTLRPTAILTFDSTKFSAEFMTKLEDMLYGKDGEEATEPKLPMPDEIIKMVNAAA